MNKKKDQVQRLKRKQKFYQNLQYTSKYLPTSKPSLKSKYNNNKKAIATYAAIKAVTFVHDYTSNKTE